MNVARCRTCGASIIWCVTVNGKRTPFDEDPDPKGLFLLDETKDPPLALYARETDPPGERFTNHFATCPDRDLHRKKETP